MLEVTISKNGNGLLVYVWNVDHTKPKVRVEGHFYVFNRDLVKKFSFTTVEQFIAKLV